MKTLLVIAALLLGISVGTLIRYLTEKNLLDCTEDEFWAIVKQHEWLQYDGPHDGRDL